MTFELPQQSPSSSSSEMSLSVCKLGTTFKRASPLTLLQTSFSDSFLPKRGEEPCIFFQTCNVRRGSASSWQSYNRKAVLNLSDHAHVSSAPRWQILLAGTSDSIRFLALISKVVHAHGPHQTRLRNLILSTIQNWTINDTRTRRTQLLIS